MQNVVHHLIRFLAVLAVITTAALATAAYNFVELTYEGAFWIQPFGTNDKGLVAGSAGFPDGSEVGFVYDPKEQTFTELPPLPGCRLYAMAINNAGVIAGDCSVSPNRNEGFILKRGTYTRFAYPGFAYTKPRAIGSIGLVTGFAGKDPDQTDVGFIYDPARETFTSIAIDGMSGLGFNTAQGVNARGRVVGNFFLESGSAYPGSPEGSYGFVREPSGAVTLFRVKQPTWEQGFPTWGRGINDSGVIAGFFQYPLSGFYAAFVGTLPSLGGYQEMTDAELILVPFGVFATFFSAIDNNGRVVGSWIDAAGWPQGFIATPVPKGKQ